ncbi:T9SS type A sorting domain-containing protein [Aequorivita marisscotiae]|uniref:T9SS type A sorting domain-containing protein n=1 Tax=Aequorivita marisscotiae TaxID=3040348 RepID=A0ABY8KRV1_9FLAO|nr:T9SS type A sorting domain-containing protein [Aequorivita sp. Ant34-E75]WGF92189.1 T9SS type A sorting domain-containing protein [Aequorivita sp. Ant34-E75]
MLMTLFSGQFLAAQIVNIPDANFKQALLENHPVIDTNGDGEIQVSEAEAATNIFVHDKNITDLTGIEAFVNITSLTCSSNPISTVDLSNNPDLELLVIGRTNLSSLDISQNTALFTLYIDNTNITEIDTSNHPNLEFLNAAYGSLESVDLSNNPNLVILKLEDTNVETLDLSSNPLLEALGIYGTVIDDLDFSLLPNLKIISLGNNNIETIDFSENPDLCSVFIGNCPALEYINLKNGNNELLVPNTDCSINVTHGGLSSTSGLNVISNNPNLSTICVDDVDFAEQNFTLVPPQTQFTEDCNLAINEYAFTSLQYYPNPVGDVLNINLDRMITKVEIYSVLGKRIKDYTIDTKQAQLKVDDLTEGIYFVTVFTEDFRKVFRIVKSG